MITAMACFCKVITVEPILIKQNIAEIKSCKINLFIHAVNSFLKDALKRTNYTLRTLLEDSSKRTVPLNKGRRTSALRS